MQMLVQQISALQNQLPTLIEQGIQSRERSYQENQTRKQMQDRQEGFEKELDAKLDTMHQIPFANRDFYRKMILNDATSRQFELPVAEYLKTMTPPAPPPPPPALRQVPGQLPPGGRPPAQTALGDWQGKTWDDFAGDPWDQRT